VVETSLGVPNSWARKLQWQNCWDFGEAAMAESWEGMGKAVMVGTHKAQEGSSGGVRWSHW
jgi:hypothetical protein